MNRSEGQGLADALPGVDAAILHAATAQQREILQTSPLDDVLLRAEQDARARAAALAARDEPSLAPFLPRRGDGAAAQRLGHRDLPDLPAEVQVRPRLPDPERADAQPALRHPRPPGARALPLVRAARTLDELLGLLEAGWRRGGFGGSEEERQLHGKADASLRRYFERDRADAAEPVWFERGFQFRLGDAHAARPRRPGRPPARRRLRAHRLQDGPPEERGPAARGRPALALRGRRPRGVAARRVAAVLPLRPRRREGAGADRGHRPGLDRRDRGRGRRRHPRARASSPRRRTRPAPGATSGSPARRPSARRRRGLSAARCPG